MINTISLTFGGYVECKSRYYSCYDVADDKKYSFHTGLNLLTGEIDSGIWSISYLLSMYKYHKKDFIIDTNSLSVSVNGTATKLEDIQSSSCYLDDIYPLFSSKKTVCKTIEKELKIRGLTQTAEQIRQMFCIDRERFNRPLGGTGSEVFQAMAAIGYAAGKDVYCFPWLSKRRVNSFHMHYPFVIDVLSKAQKIIILPMGT